MKFSLGDLKSDSILVWKLYIGPSSWYYRWLTFPITSHYKLNFSLLLLCLPSNSLTVSGAFFSQIEVMEKFSQWISGACEYRNTFFSLLNIAFFSKIKDPNLTWKCFNVLFDFNLETSFSTCYCNSTSKLCLQLFLLVRLRSFKLEFAALFLTWYSNSKFPYRLNIPIVLKRKPNNRTWDQIRTKSLK